MMEGGLLYKIFVIFLFSFFTSLFAYDMPTLIEDYQQASELSLKTKNEAIKINCLILWGKGWSLIKIKEALLISEHYISNTINKYETNKP